MITIIPMSQYFSEQYLHWQNTKIELILLLISRLVSLKPIMKITLFQLFNLYSLQHKSMTLQNNKVSIRLTKNQFNKSSNHLP